MHGSVKHACIEELCMHIYAFLKIACKEELSMHIQAFGKHAYIF
jgi:hypothetical protein